MRCVHLILWLKAKGRMVHNEKIILQNNSTSNENEGKIVGFNHGNSYFSVNIYVI